MIYDIRVMTMVRVWRALKATGAGTLREGVYVLPALAPSAQALREIERSITEAGAQAHLLQLQARDEAQQLAFQALFDRSALYAELLQSLKDTRHAMPQLGEPELRKTLRGMAQQLAHIQASDFFPGSESATAAAAVAAFGREVAQRLSPGEPTPQTDGIARLAIADFQGRRWATRARPWVDRLATAWLVQRFIDPSPSFLWLASPADCPADALGYDFDGARFTHVGDKVSFEVMALSFWLLESDAGLRRLAALVHCIDIGGIPADEAPGLELLVRGLQLQHADDDALLQAAFALFDTIYAALKERP